MHRSHSFTGAANPHRHLLHRIEHPLLSPSASANPPLAFVLCTVSLFPIASLKGRQSLFAWLLIASSLTCLFFFSGFNRLHLRVRSATSAASSRATPAPLPPLTREEYCASPPAARSASRGEAPESVLRGWSEGSSADGPARLRGNSPRGAPSSRAMDAVGGMGERQQGKAPICSKCRTLQSVLKAAVQSAISAAAATNGASAGGGGGMTIADDMAAAGGEFAEDAESASPAQLLARAARRSVIVVSFNEAWAPMMRFFLARLRAVERAERSAREQRKAEGERRGGEEGRGGVNIRTRAGVEGMERESERRTAERYQTAGDGDGEGEAGAEEGAYSSALGELVARLVVVAYDDASFEACCAMGLNCYMDWQEDAPHREDLGGGQKHFMTRAYIHLVWCKQGGSGGEHAGLGYHALFTNSHILCPSPSPMPRISHTHRPPLVLLHLGFAIATAVKVWCKVAVVASMLSLGYHVWRKVAVVTSMLALGYDVLFTDSDILWLRNPLPLLWRRPHDLQMSADWWSPNPRSVVANGGFYAARANTRTLRFFQDWLAWHRRCPQFRIQQVFNWTHPVPAVPHTAGVQLDPPCAGLSMCPQFRIQQVFNWIRPEANPFTRVGSRLLLRYLHSNQFGGFCEMGHSLSSLLTVHANCCPGLGNKLPVLKQLAADWDFFSALPVAAREGLEERGFEWKGRNCSTNWNTLPRDTPVESS
ncbi:unnamed protein product [Closterium sp. NIES-65]|nr:unnamed protein product [Closterium sp. NIES-65]